jgi:hypothetical protein
MFSDDICRSQDSDNLMSLHISKKAREFDLFTLEGKQLFLTKIILPLNAESKKQALAGKNV